MAEHENILDITQVLQAETPPEPHQRITYHVGRWEGAGVLHGENCTNAQGQHQGRAELHETTGEALKDAWREQRMFDVCDYYPGNLQTLTRMMIRCKFNFGGISQTNGWGDCGVLVHFEAFKPANVDAWCQWACGKTSEQIREKARTELEWAGAAGGEQTVVFEANGNDKASWLLAGYEHVSVIRDEGFVTGASVHGVMPRGIMEAQDNRYSGLLIPVGGWFNGAHLALAARLYEEHEDRDGVSVFGNRELAEKAVETARLVLA